MSADRPPNWTQDYTFDRYGNKTGTTASGIKADSNNVPVDGLASVGYTAASNRISDTGWEYDLSGILIRGKNRSGVWQRFEYDAAGRLVKIKDDSNNMLETYTYGASRNRLKKETSTRKTYYAWGGNSPLVEYTEATASSTPAYSKSYIYADSRLVSCATKASATSETWNYYHPDRLGTRLISNPDTVSSSMQSTLPFGTGLNAESTGYSNQVFTSYDRSGATGLDYTVKRTYSQGQGRFTQVDPIGIASSRVGNPQSNNLYSYVQNMPGEMVDPDGLESELIQGIREAAAALNNPNCRNFLGRALGVGSMSVSEYLFRMFIRGNIGSSQRYGLNNQYSFRGEYGGNSGNIGAITRAGEGNPIRYTDAGVNFRPRVLPSILTGSITRCELPRMSRSIPLTNSEV